MSCKTCTPNIQKRKQQRNWSISQAHLGRRWSLQSCVSLLPRLGYFCRHRLTVSTLWCSFPGVSLTWHACHNIKKKEKKCTTTKCTNHVCAVVSADKQTSLSGEGRLARTEESKDVVNKPLQSAGTKSDPTVFAPSARTVDRFRKDGWEPVFLFLTCKVWRFRHFKNPVDRRPAKTDGKREISL